MSIKTYTIDTLPENGHPSEREFRLIDIDTGRIEWHRQTKPTDPYGSVLHRVGAPAVMCPSGHVEWWYHGERVVSYDTYQMLTGCSDSDLLILKLRWGDIR